MFVLDGQPDVFRTFSEMEKIQFRTKFESVAKSLGDMDKYLGMFLAATRDFKFVQGVVNMVSWLRD